ncbi:hypothetical protein ACFYE2_18010, partial [Kocuria sp. CPCC 205300]|uniref:hypothetical protein n=1 Tax=Kocuria sabuli TaxID=3071448 RepID=UPI0036DBD7CE
IMRTINQLQGMMGGGSFSISMASQLMILCLFPAGLVVPSDADVQEELATRGIVWPPVATWSSS